MELGSDSRAVKFPTFDGDKAKFEAWFIGFKRSKADPCLYYKWFKDEGLSLWISFIDDKAGAGTRNAVLQTKYKIRHVFDCDEVEAMKEYIGCKIENDQEGGWMKITQPVLLQSLQDEFTLLNDILASPAVPGDVMIKGDDDTTAGEKRYYRKGVGKLLHLAKWSRVEVQNAVRELSRYMASGSQKHIQAMHQTMTYLLQTEKRGLVLKPNAIWDGNPDFEFEIKGCSDSDFAKDPESRRSVSGYCTFLNGAPVNAKSKMQQCVTLSVTEAELVSATTCAQDMLESVGLKVKSQ